MTMVQFQDLIESCLCDLANALVIAPPGEHLLHPLASLYFLHALEKDDCGAEELVLGRSVKVGVLQLLCHVKNKEVFSLVD